MSTTGKRWVGQTIDWSSVQFTAVTIAPRKSSGAAPSTPSRTHGRKSGPPSPPGSTTSSPWPASGGSGASGRSIKK